jgi:alanine racemase
VWQLNNNTELGIFEAGISQMGEMKKLSPIINPTIGILTSIGEAHQENFVSLKEKCLEKLQLFSNAEKIIYSMDNKLIDICVEQLGLKQKKMTWGKTDKADIQIVNIKKRIHQTQVFYSYAGQKDDYTIDFSDAASIENSLHCLAVLLHFNIDAKSIKEKMKALQSVAMRLEVKQGMNNCMIINDSYNSDLNSLSIALDFMHQQASDKNIKETLILSDILQSGQDIKELYQTVALLLKNKGIKKIIGIGPDLHTQQHLFQYFENYFFKTPEELLASIQDFSFKNEAILLKGSRNFHLEKISESLELIAHQTILEVDLSALIHNLNYFRGLLKPNTKMMCMVKADGYGSGASEIARTLQHNKCDYLAVAVADEGAELRKNGIHIPIIVMNPEQHSFDLIFENNLEPEIYSFNLLQKFIQSAEKQGVTNYPIHLKIDTGMHRLGFEPEDADKLIALLQEQNSLKIRSIFSHLAGADDSKFDDFTQKQISTFNTFSSKIEKAFDHQILKHILNSAGIERFSEYQYNMVRLGIGHYGISAKNQQYVRNVCTLKTTILQIKKVAHGETVGYSRKGEIKRDSLIAILPIGYADGFDRRLGNGVGKVFINNKLAPVVGNVCMDLIMVDVTDIEANEGDVVEIFGNNLSIIDVASWMNTISYEIFTGISRRVKRIYFQE